MITIKTGKAGTGVVFRCESRDVNWPMLYRMPKPLRLIHLFRDKKTHKAINRLQHHRVITSVVTVAKERTMQLFNWMI